MFGSKMTSWGGMPAFSVSSLYERVQISSFRSAVSACPRSEEHTSELQSQSNLVCRLLLEKKNPQLVRLVPQLAADLPVDVDHVRLAAARHHVVPGVHQLRLPGEPLGIPDVLGVHPGDERG